MPALPQTADLFALSADRIHRAATALWPGEPLTLGDHVPSVTGYVHRARIGDRDLFARDSILVPRLRAAWCGRWPVAGDRDRVRAAQAAYATSPGSLLEYEHVSSVRGDDHFATLRKDLAPLCQDARREGAGWPGARGCSGQGRKQGRLRGSCRGTPEATPPKLRPIPS